MNSEFIQKMILAKKYEKEAFMSLLSLALAQHVEVIEKEVQGIVLDLAKGWLNAAGSTTKDAEESKTIKKVTIS